MEPTRVRAEARSRGCEGGDPQGWLAALEAACVRDPADRGLRELLLALDDEVRLLETTPALVGGVRRQELARFDALSATWRGLDTVDGSPVLVRAPRPGGTPVARRALARELARVAPAVGARLVEDGSTAVVAAPGWPASPDRGLPMVRSVVAGLSALSAFRDRVGADPAVGEEELRVTADGRLVLCTLTPSPADATAALLDRLVDEDDPEEIAVALRGVVEAGGDREDAVAVLRGRMVAELVSRRLDLHARWRAGRRRWSSGRLLHSVRRLHEAVPPPRGRGAVGVGLDGSIVVLVSDADGVRVGAEEVWDPVGGLRPVPARYLLRLRAGAVPSLALDKRVGGTPGLTDAVCRWVAAALQLRLTRLLLEQEVR